MIKMHLSYRNARGHMQSVDPFNVPAEAPDEIKIVAEAMREVLTVKEAEPKRGRGRPKGYRCSDETIARMREGRQRVTEARRREYVAERCAEMAVAWQDEAAAYSETQAVEEAFQMGDGA